MTPDAILEDCNLVISDGVIHSIGAESRGREIDLKGGSVIPGMMDLHCDAIEKELEPRAGVLMPGDFALSQIDTRNLMAGITSIFHCFSFAGKELGVRDPIFARDMILRLKEMQPLLSVRNKVHARFEVTHLDCVPMLKDLIDRGAIHLLSFMDHSPGQGQYKEVGSYKKYLMSNYKKTSEEADEIIAHKDIDKVKIKEVVGDLARYAKERNVVLVSHDDDSPKKVEDMFQLGVKISEFPLNIETALRARELGMHTIVGAPNVVRGGSQCNGVSALDLISKNAASGIASDYIPSTMLEALFIIVEKLNIPLNKAIKLVSSNAAKVFTGGNSGGNSGVIEVGAVADIVGVSLSKNQVRLRHVFVGGRLRFSRDYS